MEESLVHGLQPVEPGHGAVVFEIAAAADFSGFFNPPHFLPVGVGGADVFKSPELLDERAIEPFLRLHQREPDAPLRRDLPDGDDEGNGHHGQHEQPDAPIGVDGGDDREEAGEHGRNGIGESDFEKFHVAFHAAGDPAVQRADAFGRHDSEVHLEKVADEAHQHRALDAGGGALDDPAAGEIERLLQHVGSC